MRTKNRERKRSRLRWLGRQGSWMRNRRYRVTSKEGRKMKSVRQNKKQRRRGMTETGRTRKADTVLNG
jgi:hypothetical protein